MPGDSRRRCIAACETCKRRKERCNGTRPCVRCVERRVEDSCVFVQRVRRSSCGPNGRRQTRRRPTYTQFEITQNSAPTSIDTCDELPESSTYSRSSDNPVVSSSPAPNSPSDFSRMIQDHNGRHMFIGDSANLSFLQTIRRVVEDCIGACAFVDDPLRCLMVEATPKCESKWVNGAMKNAPAAVSLGEGRFLIRRYGLATNCVLDLFDEEYLLEQLPGWIEGRSSASSLASPIFYLILAIGAQSSPRDQDELAATFFTHGRFLTAQDFMDDASLATVQSYALITFYLLGACRRNAAFMHLGIAVRAAYAVGLHRKEVAASFSSHEFATRERIWKCLRILDLFMSASMGRPPSTAETRDTESKAEYSASTDLCAIFEKILTGVYSRRMVSTKVLTSIGGHHRRWTARFFRGLATDRILAADRIQDGSMPNIGLLHVKEAYYWTIILLTRPFLTESIAVHMRKTLVSGPKQAAEPCTASDSNQILVEACVDSAIRTIDLLKVLKGCKDIPKRLPFVNNSLFIAGLVLGMAFFGDLYQIYPLERYLKIANDLLAQFSYDQIAQRNADIINYLRDACNLYLEQRSAQNIDHNNLAISSIFGQIHRVRPRSSTRPPSPSHHGDGHMNHDALDGTINASRNDADRLNGPLLSQGDLDGTPAPDDLYDFLLEDDTVDGNMPFSNMLLQTLWFDSYDATTPMFSIINDTQVC